MTAADDPTYLPLLYHLNSEPWLIPEGLHEPAYKEAGGGVALPPPRDSRLVRLIRARRSWREFTGRAIDPESLGTLLGGAYGITGLQNGAYTRAAPSGGGLYPLELYVISAQGVAHYNVRDHAQEPFAPAPAPGDLSTCFLGQPWVETAGAVILIAAVFLRNQRKYGPRGYRYALLEAGHVAQNVCLIAGDLGLGSVCLGGFSDARLNRLLQLDGRREAILYGVAVGHPAVAG